MRNIPVEDELNWFGGFVCFTLTVERFNTLITESGIVVVVLVLCAYIYMADRISEGEKRGYTREKTSPCYLLLLDQQQKKPPSCNAHV